MKPIKKKYKVIHDKANPQKWCVQLLPASGVWNGILYSYGRFRISEPKSEEDPIMMTFERDILYVPDSLRGKEFSDEEEKMFTTLLGEIIIDIIFDHPECLQERDGKLYLELKEGSDDSGDSPKDN